MEVILTVLMKNMYANIQRSFTIESLLEAKRINCSMIRVTASTLPLQYRLNQKEYLVAKLKDALVLEDLALREDLALARDLALTRKYVVKV